MSRTTESIRWRGGQVTRLEALTDAVFGFAITLLIVKLEVPGTFDDLMQLVPQFVPFAFAFTLLILVWWYHYQLFSKFDLEDGWTVVLNSILLFVVLFYVYPLKFVASFLLGGNARDAFRSVDQIPDAMAIYGLGFVAVFGVFALMYHHAWRLRDRLRLTPLEVWSAREHVANCSIMVAVGLISVALAQSIPHWSAGMLSGFSYFLIGPAQYFNGRYFNSRRAALVAVSNT